MKIKIISFDNFSWTSSIMKNANLEKIYEIISDVNLNSTSEFKTENKGNVAFFCMERRDTLTTFKELKEKIITELYPTIYFPYSHLSSSPLNFKDSCILFREISLYLKKDNSEIVIAPFFYHKPYTLKTTDEPIIHFYDSEGEIDTREETNNRKTTLTNNLYLDDVFAPREALKGSYFKGPVAIAIESILSSIYKKLLLKRLPYVREVESPLLYNYEGKIVKHYLTKFPARQFYLKSSNKEYFLRIATCHGVFSRLSEIKDLKIPIGYYEKGLCFRKEQEGEIKRGERYSSFTMPDCHLIVPYETSEIYFNTVRDLLAQYYTILGLDYKTILRTTGFLKDNAFWTSIEKITSENYFCEKGEFEIRGIQLATVQLDNENSKTYFKEKQISIIHFAPGSLERIAMIIGERLDLLVEIVPLYNVEITLEKEEVLEGNNMIINNKEKLSSVLSEITDTIYSLIVIGDVEKQLKVVKKVLKIKDKKGVLFSKSIFLK